MIYSIKGGIDQTNAALCIHLALGVAPAIQGLLQSVRFQDLNLKQSGRTRLPGKETRARFCDSL